MGCSPRGSWEKVVDRLKRKPKRTEAWLEPTASGDERFIRETQLLQQELDSPVTFLHDSKEGRFYCRTWFKDSKGNSLPLAAGGATLMAALSRLSSFLRIYRDVSKG